MGSTNLQRLYASSSRAENAYTPQAIPSTSTPDDNVGADSNDDDLLIDNPEILNEVDGAPLIDINSEVAGKKFLDLGSRPHPGSLLYVASKPGLRKKDLNDYLSRRWGSNMITCVFDPEVAAWTYFLYSLVLPHQSALEVAEKVQQEVTRPGSEQSEFTVLSKLVGRDLNNSADIANVARGLVRRVPVLLDYIQSFIKSK